MLYVVRGVAKSQTRLSHGTTATCLTWKDTADAEQQVGVYLLDPGTWPEFCFCRSLAL